MAHMAVPYLHGLTPLSNFEFVVFNSILDSILVPALFFVI